MFIMFKTLFITTKTNTLISKVPETLISIEFDILLPFPYKTVTRCRQKSETQLIKAFADFLNLCSIASVHERKTPKNRNCYLTRLFDKDIKIAKIVY